MNDSVAPDVAPISAPPAEVPPPSVEQIPPPQPVDNAAAAVVAPPPAVDDYGVASQANNAVPPPIPNQPPPADDDYGVAPQTNSIAPPPIPNQPPPAAIQPPAPAPEARPIQPPEAEPIQPPASEPAAEAQPIQPPAPEPAPEAQPIQPPEADPIQPPAPEPEAQPIQPPSEPPVPAPEAEPIQPPAPEPAPEAQPIQPPAPEPAPEAQPIQPPEAEPIQPPAEPPVPAPEAEPVQPPAPEQPAPEAQPPSQPAAAVQPAAVISETVIVHVSQDDKTFKVRIARDMVKVDHVKKIACKLFHADPLKVHLMDDKTNTPMDDNTLTDMALNGTVSDIFTKLGEGTGMIRVVLNVNSLSKPVSEPVPFDMFMPTCSVLDVANSLSKRGSAVSQPSGFTGFVLVNLEGRELQDSDDATLDKLPQTQENTVALNAVPLEEMQDVNIADVTNPDVKRCLNIKFHLSTAADVIRMLCAKVWEFDPEKCILQVLTAEGGFSLEPTVTLQAILSSHQPQPIVTAQPGALSLLFCHFEPITLTFWFNGDSTVEVVLKEGLQTDYVKTQAATVLHIHDITQWALVQHGTGRVIVADKVNIEEDGRDFELVLISSLTTIVAPFEDPNMPQASVQYYPVTESSTLSIAEFLAAVPKPEPDSELALFVNGIEAAMTLPVSSLGGEQTSVMIVDLKHTNLTLFDVSVSSEKCPGEPCKFKVASTVLAEGVRSHAASLLKIENAADALLSDKEGCIIDDLCAMSDMESYEFVLLD